MRRGTAVLFLLAAALPALAKPPESTGARTLDEARAEISAKEFAIRERLAYEAKPREEKILLEFLNGDEKFERDTLTPTKVTRMILKWPEIEVEEIVPGSPAHRVLLRTGVEGEEYGLLAKALHRHFERAKADKGLNVRDRRERATVSHLLVDLLDSDRIYVCQAAFDSLCMIYSIPRQPGLGYRPTDPKDLRREKQKVWDNYVKREAKR